MAKAPTLPTITGQFASSTQLNAAFRAIEDSFENTLSLDGSTPNSMGADLDMNGNDILNVGNLEVETLAVEELTVNGSSVQELVDRVEDALDRVETAAELSAEDAQAWAVLAENIVRFSVLQQTVSITTVAGQDFYPFDPGFDPVSQTPDLFYNGLKQSADFYSVATVLGVRGILLAAAPAYSGDTVLYSAARLNNAAGTERVIFASAVPVSHTGTIAKTAVATVVIPGGSLGPNGYMTAQFEVYTANNTADNKVVTLEYGGTTIHQTPENSFSNTRNFGQAIWMHNANSVVAQTFRATGTTNPFGVSISSGARSGTVNSAVDQNLVLSLTLANSANTISLQRLVVTVCYMP